MNASAVSGLGMGPQPVGWTSQPLLALAALPAMARFSKAVVGSVAIADMTEEATAAVSVLATMELVAPAGAASVVGSGAA